MAIIAIVSAIVIPSLITFGISRRVNDAASAMLAAAQWARTQSIVEARTYRLNVDSQSRTYWLSADSGAGNFEDLTNEHGKHVTLPDDVTVTVDVEPQPVILMNQNPTVQSQLTSIPVPTELIDGEQIGTAGQLMVNPHEGTFIEFQPTGRSDPATITLADSKFGKKLQVVCSSAAEPFHIPTDSQK